MPAHWLDSLRSVDLRELDLTNAGTWSPARKASVALAWLGLLLISGYALLLQVSVARLHQLHEAQATLKATFESRATQVAGLEAYQLQVHRLQAGFDGLHAQLPAQAQVPELLDEVSRLGQGNGLLLEHIQWLPEVLQTFYAKLPLHMTLVGGYHELGLFVSALASLPRIVTVHDLSLAPSNGTGDGQLRMTLLARAYRSHDQGLAP